MGLTLPVRGTVPNDTVQLISPRVGNVGDRLEQIPQ